MNLTPSPVALDFAQLWKEALPYAQFVSEAEKNRQLWADVYRLARLPDWAIGWAEPRQTPIRMLAITEDWCGDAVNTLPILAKFADVTGAVELRVLRRDAYPAVMDRYLTAGTRSIPIVIALDTDFSELGSWGPRPSPLQEWVRDHKDTMSKEDRYREVRRWYAKDRGATTLREVLSLVP